MTLYYSFEGESLPFIPNDIELHAFLDSLSSQKLRGIAKTIWKTLTPVEKEYYNNEYDIETETDWDAAYPGINRAIEELLLDSENEDKFYEQLSNELTEYFANDAYNAFQESKEFSDDPYGYLGLNTSDFL